MKLSEQTLHAIIARSTKYCATPLWRDWSIRGWSVKATGPGPCVKAPKAAFGYVPRTTQPRSTSAEPCTYIRYVPSCCVLRLLMAMDGASFRRPGGIAGVCIVGMGRRLANGLQRLTTACGVILSRAEPLPHGSLRLFSIGATHPASTTKGPGGSSSIARIAKYPMQRGVGVEVGGGRGSAGRTGRLSGKCCILSIY